jgi:hypothetical protein
MTHLKLKNLPLKKNFYTLALFTVSISAFSQVGIGITAPHPSSMLDITSTAKGFLMPRMSTTERTGIATPASGLEVYDTTTNTIWYYNGTIWVNTAVSSVNLYNSDGTLDTNRTVSMGDKTLSFVSAAATGTSHFVIDNSTLNVDAVNHRVGIGISNPVSKLEVNGSSTNTSSYNAVASTTIDFSRSNLAYTTANAGAFTLQNIKDGGTYTLSVRGTTAGTSTFTAAGFTVRYINNRATVINTHTLYTLVVIGTVIYVYIATAV